MPIRQFRDMRRCYGFEEVAIVPGDVTVNPEQTSIDLKLGNLTFPVPILAAAMDAVVDAKFAVAFSKLGGLAVLNLEGVQARYDNPSEILAEIAQVPINQATPLLQKVYSQPIKDKIVGDRVREIKNNGGVCAVSLTPANTKKLASIIVEAGADVLVVQSTVTTARHVSKSLKGLVFSELCKSVPIPVVVGNAVSHSAALELMKTGIAGLLVGVGPGATCTTRQVLGIGVPQVTATIDCAAARDFYFKKSGKYVSIITDGGMNSGGDICKAFASGADAVMVGSAFARTEEAPGRGFHWGMATPHHNLPRGTRIRVGVTGTLEEILYGPSRLDDGSQNLVGALKTCMGAVCAANIKEMHLTEIILAPSIRTEGKIFQKAQQIGMGKF